MQLSLQLINILTSYEGESVLAGEYRLQKLQAPRYYRRDENLRSSLVPDYLTYKYQSLELSQSDLKINTSAFLLLTGIFLIRTPHLLSSTWRPFQNIYLRLLEFLSHFS